MCSFPYLLDKKPEYISTLLGLVIQKSLFICSTSYMLVFLSVTISTKMAKLMVYRCLSGHMKSRLSLLNLLRPYI